jgi:hypothetical protein
VGLVAGAGTGLTVGCPGIGAIVGCPGTVDLVGDGVGGS